MLNEEFARVMRPGTWFALLDPALVLEIFCRYDLGLKYARWKHVQQLHYTEAYLAAHEKGTIGAYADFVVGPQWFVERVMALPEYMNFDISAPNIHCAFTWVAGRYRVVAVESRHGTDIYWYNARARVVSHQLLYAQRFGYISRPGYIVMYMPRSAFCEYSMVLPQIGYRRRAGCCVM